MKSNFFLIIVLGAFMALGAGSILYMNSVVYSVHHQAFKPSPLHHVKKTAISGSVNFRPASGKGITLPVLMYHYVRKVEDRKVDPLGYGLSTTPEDFRRQMQFLADGGYVTVTPDELSAVMEKNEKLPSKSVMLTFDDGYEDFYTAAYPILKEYNFKSTLFVITGAVGDAEGRYVTWDQLKELDRSGLVVVGSHTINHPDLVKDKFAKTEIEGSKATLEEKLGHPITAFCYPSGVYNEQTVEMVKAAGYSLAFTTRPGILMESEKRFTLPRVRISGGILLDKFERRLAGEIL